MGESTLLILAGLGVLAWLLAGGWPYAKDRYVADDGPLGLGAGITAVCPGCAQRARAFEAGVADYVVAGGRMGASASVGAGPSLRPLGVGRDASLHLECPSCRAVYTVVGSGVLPTPRDAVD